MQRESGGSLTDLGTIWRESGGSLTEIGKMWREEGGSLVQIWPLESTVSNLNASDASTNCDTQFPFNQIQLTWDENGDGSDVDYVEVRRTEPVGFDSNPQVAWGTGSYNDSDVGAGITACYNVRVVYNDGSTGPWSNEACATTCSGT